MVSALLAFLCIRCLLLRCSKNTAQYVQVFSQIIGLLWLWTRPASLHVLSVIHLNTPVGSSAAALTGCTHSNLCAFNMFKTIISTHMSNWKLIYCVLDLFFMKLFWKWHHWSEESHICTGSEENRIQCTYMRWFEWKLFTFATASERRGTTNASGVF